MPFLRVVVIGKLVQRSSEYAKKSGGLEKKWRLEWSITDSPFNLYEQMK